MSAHSNEEDPGASTEAFRVFASQRQAEERSERRGAAGASFRIATLLIGVLVLAFVVWFMLRL